ncbi:MAG: DUF4249 family protein [Flavobacteriales bacterium]
MNNSISLNLFIWTLLVFSCVLYSCEKELELIIPPTENKYVIEGNIEIGQPAFVLISQTRDYNQSINTESFNGFYLGGAQVSVSNGTVTEVLDEICTGDLPAELLLQVAEITGLSPVLLSAASVCGYIDLDGSMLGAENSKYNLEVSIDEKLITATTTIPGIVELDSMWFDLAGETNDSLGFIYAQLTDPDTTGNAYRWFAKRINAYPQWADYSGQQKDLQYIAPLGSSYDDSFFNGLTFDFAYYRGSLLGSPKADDQNEERGFFKRGDTIAVKGAAIDRGTYDYIVTFEAEAGSAGNPFTIPTPIASNIEGGLGIWAGYASVLDTIIANPN